MQVSSWSLCPTNFEHTYPTFDRSFFWSKNGEFFGTNANFVYLKLGLGPKISEWRAMINLWNLQLELLPEQNLQEMPEFVFAWPLPKAYTASETQQYCSGLSPHGYHHKLASSTNRSLYKPSFSLSRFQNYLYKHDNSRPNFRKRCGFDFNLLSFAYSTNSLQFGSLQKSI